MLPYASQPDIHEAIRTDFGEALRITEDLPGLLASLRSIMASLEESQFGPPETMLLAGSMVKRDHEKMGMRALWEDPGLEVLDMLVEAARSDEDWNAAEVINQKYPDRSDIKTTIRLAIASSIMINHQIIRATQATRLRASKLATIYDTLFYGGILNGIGRKYQTKVIIDRLKDAAVSITIGEIPGAGLFNELAELLTDLFNLENIFRRKAGDLAGISRYLKSYLQALRIVVTLALTLSDLNASLSDSFVTILRAEDAEL
jgi:hypothetical protein